MEFQVRRRPSGLHIPCGVAIVCHTAANFIHASHVTSKFRFIAREVVLVSKLKLALIAGTCEELVAIKVHRTMCHLLLLLRQSQQNAGQVEVGFVFYLADRSEVPALPFISQVFLSESVSHELDCETLNSLPESQWFGRTPLRNSFYIGD